MNWQVSPPLRYVDRHKCTINFEIIYNFVVKRKNRCFMLNSFVTPCQVSPKGARSGYVRQITSKALYLSSLDHLYKLTWCIFRVELFYLSLPKVFVPKLIRRCTEIDPYLQRDFIGT